MPQLYMPVFVYMRKYTILSEGKKFQSALFHKKLRALNAHREFFFLNPKDRVALLTYTPMIKIPLKAERVFFFPTPG